MKKLLMAVLFLASCSTSATTYKNEANLTWLHENYRFIRVEVSKANSSHQLPIINTIGEIWKRRDGGTSGEVSPLIAKALISSPSLMLSVFEENPDSFKTWLNELESPLFTDFTGEGYDELIALHKELLEAMTIYTQTGDTRLTPFAEQLVDELKGISVRVVD